MGTDHDIDALLATMRQQAEAEKAEILTQAQAEVQQVYAQGETEIQAQMAESLRQSERQISLESDRILGQVQMENSGKVLATKNRIIKRAFDQADQDLRAVPNSSKYRSFLEILIEQAIQSVGQDACLTVAEQDKDLCAAIIAEKRLSCSLITRAGQPGTVIATSKDGRRRANNSIGTRLARVEQLMKHDIAQILYGSGAAGDNDE